MTNIELINNLTETFEFKELQSLGLKIHQEKRKFDLLTVFEELIDEMAWSRLFAYLFTIPLQCAFIVFTAFLKGNIPLSCAMSHQLSAKYLIDCNLNSF